MALLAFYIREFIDESESRCQPGAGAIFDTLPINLSTPIASGVDLDTSYKFSLDHTWLPVGGKRFIVGMRIRF
jgi:hypothetical protein